MFRDAKMTDNKTHKTGMFHPGELPPFFSMADFIGFLSAQGPVLDLLEDSILQLEKGDLQNSPATIKRLFHTMKGESGFLALDEVQAVCHRTEDLFDEDLVNGDLTADL